MTREENKILMRGITLFVFIAVLCLNHHLKSIPSKLKSRCLVQIETVQGKCSEIVVNGRDVRILAIVPETCTIDSLESYLSGIPGIRSLDMEFSVEIDSIKLDIIRRLSDRSILFAKNSYINSFASEALLDSLVYTLKTYPRIFLILRGWTDKEGDSTYNQMLSEKRAGIIREALIQRGCDSTRIRTFGFGERWPVTTGWGDSLARRVDFLLEE